VPLGNCGELLELSRSSRFIVPAQLKEIFQFRGGYGGARRSVDLRLGLG